MAAFVGYSGRIAGVRLRYSSAGHKAGFVAKAKGVVGRLFGRRGQ